MAETTAACSAVPMGATPADLRVGDSVAHSVQSKVAHSAGQLVARQADAMGFDLVAHSVVDSAETTVATTAVQSRQRSWVAETAVQSVYRRAVVMAFHWAAKSVSKGVVMAAATAAEWAVTQVGAKAETLENERAVRLAWRQAAGTAV